jgi:hypothetical protein
MADEDKCRWYLEDYLNKLPYERGRADIAAESLNSYANSLFAQLYLRRICTWISGRTSSSHKLLEVDVIKDSQDSNAVSSGTVHRLHWEVLEYPRLWTTANLRTTIRRNISQRETLNLSIKRVESWSQGVPAVNILLVISRRLDGKGREEVDPSLVLHSMQTLKRDLESRGAIFRLNIEIVRPGSFEALEKHLDKRSKHRRNGDIHIVHFDVHGQAGRRVRKAKKTNPQLLSSTSNLRKGMVEN